MANLQQDCDVLIDQLRAIDNRRLIKKIGIMPDSLIKKTRENLNDSMNTSKRYNGKKHLDCQRTM